MPHTRPRPTDDAREAAARLVAEPGEHRALLISPRNDGLGWIELADAISTGLAYAVKPRADLLCVDLDLDGSGGPGSALAFDAVAAAADRCGVAHLVCHSGREGHRHLFCVTGDLEVETRRRVDEALRSAGLDVRRTAIRPPLAPHRDALGWSSLAGPIDALSASAGPAAVTEFLEAVEQQLVPSVRCQRRDTPAARDAHGTRPLRGVDAVRARLSARIVTLLRFGHRRSRYPSASEARMAVAAAVAAAGGGVEELAALLEDPRHLLGLSYRRRPRRWRVEECARMFSKLGRRTDGQIDAWCRAVSAAPWSGQAGHTDLAGAELLASMARRCGSRDVALATAELAVEIGVCDGTARRSLRRLRDAGWLQVVEPPTVTHAAVYRLQIPAGIEQTSSPADDRVGVDLGCDAARRGALGRAAVRVWRLLTTPSSAAELASGLAVGAATVRAHLRRLERFGCARRNGERWERCGDLAGAAHVGGTGGRRLTARRALRGSRRVRRARLRRCGPGARTPARDPAEQQRSR